MSRSDRPWEGGYIRKTTRGDDRYYIRRRVKGRLYEVSTGCSTKGAARRQLAIFEMNPSGYRPGGDPEGAVPFDKALVELFLTWSRDVKKNSRTWVRDQKVALGWWNKKLGNVDLRSVQTSELVRCLDGVEHGRKQKVATLKTLYGWLRKVRHSLTVDPTASLTVPQARPEQWTTPKTFSPETYQATRPKLTPQHRDAVDVLAGTGWHVTELLRFAEGGAVERHPMRAAWVLVCPRRKSGEPQRTEVSDAVAAAGKRLVGKPLDFWAFRRDLDAASGGEIQPGSFRHSVATWAINSGADPAAVAAFLGHKSPMTTRRFYATHAVAAKVPTLA